MTLFPGPAATTGPITVQTGAGFVGLAPTAPVLFPVTAQFVIPDTVDPANLIGIVAYHEPSRSLFLVTGANACRVPGATTRITLSGQIVHPEKFEQSVTNGTSTYNVLLAMGSDFVVQNLCQSTATTTVTILVGWTRSPG